MSGIAGILHVDGAPVEPGMIERMTAAMAHRGPDGIRHWSKGSVALGQCMLCTTPESLDERGPLANEDASLVLVMDGRVDNGEELRRDLHARGAVLRDRTDAELVLRAYEAWGDECPDRIIGEFAFFVWDGRRQRLFGARDAAGTRHFYYHAGNGWIAFASEIKGLLATGIVEPRLNESRVLDYLVVEFDRDDEVGTFYEGIDRLPAGHAMHASWQGVTAWRYWDPASLPELRLESTGECAEAFLEQLRVAVKCRLRSTARVAAMLSGGLDSSSIVGLIRKEFRGELRQPLRTYSLIRQDRENCSDWRAIQEMLRDGWIEPTIITSEAARDACQALFGGIGDFDEPFGACHAFTDLLLFEGAQRDGCSVVLDGIAGDLHFYSPERSLGHILGHRRFSRVPALAAANRRHGLGFGIRALALGTVRALAPAAMRAPYRKLRSRNDIARAMRVETPGDLRAMLHRTTATQFLAKRFADRIRASDGTASATDHAAHAGIFTSGTLSFAHEIVGQIAFSKGIELRSPFSDRRLIELSVRMPPEAKLAVPSYKHLLRTSMTGILPDAVRGRRTVGEHPGPAFREQLISQAAAHGPGVWSFQEVGGTLKPWVDVSRLAAKWSEFDRTREYAKGLNLFTLVVLAQWMVRRFPQGRPFQESGSASN